jgi:HPt (histidine-containing phosphotransfer) domain-containing protein
MDDILSKPYALDDCTRLLKRWLPRADAVPVTPASKPSAAASQTPARVVGSPLDSIDANAVAALRSIRDGKQTGFYGRLVELFRSGSAESLAGLRTALEAGDLATAASVCHKLASSAANVGALAYAKQVRQLEQLCIAGDNGKARHMSVTLQAAHAPLVAALQNLCLRETA